MTSPSSDSRSQHFELGLFVGASSDIVTLDDVLTADADERKTLDVSPSAACISLIVDGSERWGPRLSFGALGIIVAQLPQAADRLVRGERAVIRSGGFGSPVNEYVLLDPTGEATVASVVATDEESVWLWLPHEGNAEELYAFIDEHTHEMARLGLEMRGIDPVAIATDETIVSLRREATRGAAMIDLIGPGIG